MSIRKKTAATLALGALGIVFGDIGTSPLYVFSTVFGQTGYHLDINQATVYGVISLIIWSISLVVSIKFLGFIMAADNAGEGGIMALIAEVKGGALKGPQKWAYILLGLIGVSLFYGDSTITPAISVLSAVEGLKVVAPKLTSFIIPVTLLLLTGVFAIQRFGTALIGRLFGPVMAVWFITIAVAGGSQIWLHPEILRALSPLVATHFFITEPTLGLIAMGAVVLAITGVEALYADMGHFGRAPIAKAWFSLVFPALLICYMGQGALILHNPEAAANPFLLLFPATLRIPAVLLATVATIIASQSVIAGAFSLTRQAIQLNYLPHMLVRHTSNKYGGQIYLPAVNAALFTVVVLLVVLFGSSTNLANAYGIAVSGTLAIDTILYLVVMQSSWQKPIIYILIAALAFLPLDFIFLVVTLPKILQGGWFPILIGMIMFLIITTWLQGQYIVGEERKALEGSLQDFIQVVRRRKKTVARVPGTGIYIGHHPGFTPLALHATFDELHELPAHVVIVSVETSAQAHISESKRVTFDKRGLDVGISYVKLTFGFHDIPNIPHALECLCLEDPVRRQLALDLHKAAYFISISRVVPTKRHNLAPWRKDLYCMMFHNAASASDYYKLPIERTVELQSLVPL